MSFNLDSLSSQIIGPVWVYNEGIFRHAKSQNYTLYSPFFRKLQYALPKGKGKLNKDTIQIQNASDLTLKTGKTSGKMADFDVRDTSVNKRSSPCPQGAYVLMDQQLSKWGLKTLGVPTTLSGVQEFKAIFILTLLTFTLMVNETTDILAQIKAETSHYTVVSPFMPHRNSKKGRKGREGQFQLGMSLVKKKKSLFLLHLILEYTPFSYSVWWNGKYTQFLSYLEEW